MLNFSAIASTHLCARSCDTLEKRRHIVGAFRRRQHVARQGPLAFEQIVQLNVEGLILEFWMNRERNVNENILTRAEPMRARNGPVQRIRLAK